MTRDPLGHVDTDLVPERPMRIAVIVNMVAPYTKPLFEQLARRNECELLVVSETPMERDRHWSPEVELPFEHVLLDSWTLDLAPLAVGSGFKTRFDTYVYVPKRPLHALEQFAPDVVVAAGGGIWSSPANIAALAARRRRAWAIATWWGSFTRPHPTWPRRLADPWVKYFMRSADACFAYGSRHVHDLAQMGVDPARIVVAPITALTPEHPPARGNARRGDDTRFLFVGRFIERKGIETLLEAFRLARLGELYLVGDWTAPGDRRAHHCQRSTDPTERAPLGRGPVAGVRRSGRPDRALALRGVGACRPRGARPRPPRDHDRPGRRRGRPHRSGCERIRCPSGIGGGAGRSNARCGWMDAGAARPCCAPLQRDPRAVLVRARRRWLRAGLGDRARAP